MCRTRFAAYSFRIGRFPAKEAGFISDEVLNRAEVQGGFCSERLGRKDNQHYAGLWLGNADGPGLHGVIAAVADGVGGARGGRVAAELAVRSLIDGLLSASPALALPRVAARCMDATNRWIHAMDRADPALAGMSCTLTALVLRGRRLHLLHAGDTRLYRLRDGRLERLTTDDTPGRTPGRPGTAHGRARAIGATETLRLDHAEETAKERDRYLICSDGVHGGLSDRHILEELDRRAAPEEAARRLVEAALASPVGDHATALVLDLLRLPPPDWLDIEAVAAALPVCPPPRRGAEVDGYALDEMLADARYSRVFRGRDLRDGERPVVLKFPKPGTAAEASFRQAYLRESWIAARLRSPFLGEVLEPAAGRQASLYSVMPHYGGETLERRIRRGPPVALEAGLDIAGKLGRAVAALHRAGVIHRDIKPDNLILLPGGGLRLIDFGVARLPNLDDFAAPDIPGTPSYMAPELHAGAAGDARSDIFALGVTLHRMFTGDTPYGEVEPFAPPRYRARERLAARRPDLPAWLDQVIGRAVAVAPQDRFADAMELVAELEIGMARGAPRPAPPHSLHDRNPLQFWRVVSALLALALLTCLAMGRMR